MCRRARMEGHCEARHACRLPHSCGFVHAMACARSPETIHGRIHGKKIMRCTSVLSVTAGAGGDLPQQASVVVTEINPNVIALRDLFCIPRDDDRFQVLCEDGASSVRDGANSINVLLVDGFDLNGQSAQLCAQHFYDDCHRSLVPEGIVELGRASQEFDSITRCLRPLCQLIVPTEDR